MNFFKHYKNKPYRKIGEAVHSETLESHVVYECLYKNDIAKTWIRPKKMFEEKITVDGKQLARFQRIDADVKSFTLLEPATISIIVDLANRIFKTDQAQYIHSRLESESGFYLQIAYIESQPVGFKLGYRLGPELFYSWLGGVLDTHRGLGLAKQLMTNQIDWCRENGYKVITTKTRNQFQSMLLLNLKMGFSITGFEVAESISENRIWLEKRL